MLPKTSADISNGGLYQQAVRCGKSGCCCESGNLHEGYFYFIRRIDGRLRKTYVPKKHVAAFAGLVEKARREKKAERLNRVSDSELLSTLRANLRENDSMIRNLVEALKQNG